MNKQTESLVMISDAYPNSVAVLSASNLLESKKTWASPNIVVISTDATAGKTIFIGEMTSGSTIIGPS